MSKHIYLLKFFKKIRYSLNSLILKNSKKLNFKGKRNLLSQFISAKRVLVASIFLIILSFSYLSIPILYNKNEIQADIKNQLKKKFNINFIFSTDLKYNVFPWPNYKFENVQILNDNNNQFVDIKNLKINLEIVNFFSSKNLVIKEIFLSNAKFSFYKQDLNFFFNLLDNDYSKSRITITDSYVFLKNNLDEVLFINKIKLMEYFYNSKKMQNNLKLKNEIFNIPYNLDIFNDKNEKKIFTKINIPILKLLLDTEYNYEKDLNKGLINIINNKKKSKVNFNLTKEKFLFEITDKMKDTNFNYVGNIYLKPFDFDLIGRVKKLDLKYFTNPNSILLQFLKTEIFNNKNLNLTSKINVEKIFPYQKFVNFLLNFKIKEGLIDIDDSQFSWSNYADFKILNSLLYINDNNLILDGKLKIKINDFNEIYKFFQTPRNFRKEIQSIEFIFNYNFDQSTFNILNIKIDDQNNLRVGKVLEKLISQENILQNRIYLKNTINRAIKAYAG